MYLESYVCEERNVTQPIFKKSLDSNKNRYIYLKLREEEDEQLRYRF